MFQWEAKLESNPFYNEINGYRPGRSAHDAIEAIFNSLHFNRPKWVFGACIRKCFEPLDYSYLLKKLTTFPQMEDQISKMAKGIFEEYANIPKIEREKPGTVEGAIPPLLSNVALHGLFFHLKEYVIPLSFKPSPPSNRGEQAKKTSFTIVRYADKPVVIHSEEILDLCIDETRKWFSKFTWNVDTFFQNNLIFCFK